MQPVGLKGSRSSLDPMDESRVRHGVTGQGVRFPVLAAATHPASAIFTISSVHSRQRGRTLRLPLGAPHCSEDRTEVTVTCECALMSSNAQ